MNLTEELEAFHILFLDNEAQKELKDFIGIQNSFHVGQVAIEGGRRGWIIGWNDVIYMAGNKAECDKAIEHCLSPGVGKHSVMKAEQCPICHDKTMRPS